MPTIPWFLHLSGCRPSWRRWDINRRSLTTRRSRLQFCPFRLICAAASERGSRDKPSFYAPFSRPRGMKFTAELCVNARARRSGCSSGTSPESWRRVPWDHSRWTGWSMWRWCTWSCLPPWRSIPRSTSHESSLSEMLPPPEAPLPRRNLLTGPSLHGPVDTGLPMTISSWFMALPPSHRRWIILSPVW